MFLAIMGHTQNELRNVAGLILKLRISIAVQDMKISFYMQVLVPPYFWLVPPHFVCSGDGTVHIDIILQKHVSIF